MPTSSISRLLLGFVIAAAAAAAGSRASAADPPMPSLAQSQQAPITIQLTPYFWFGSLDGSVGNDTNTADVDVGFDEIWDHLDFGGMLALEAREGQWGLLLDVLYLDLSEDADTGNPIFDKAEVGVEQLVLEGAFAYRVADQGAVWVDTLAGARYWDIETGVELESDVSPDLEFDGSENWVDPIVGARIGFDLGSNFFLVGHGDVGGFDVGSEFTWQIIGTVGYRVSDAVAIQVGYRYLDVDYDDDGFVYDVATQGFLAGVSFSF